MFVSDYKNTIEYAKEEGIEIGRAEGLVEGRAEGLVEGISTVIKNMLASGLTYEKIAELTQIPLDEVEQYAIMGTFDE